MTYLLNKRELAQIAILNKEFLQRFKKDPESVESLCYFLGDNAAYAKIWSAISGKIPTFRRNSGKYWFPAHKRWLTSTDKLACLGFPADDETASVMGVKRVPSLDARRSAKFTGNAMHFGNASLILLIGLTCFGKKAGNEAPLDSVDWRSAKRLRRSWCQQCTCV